MEGTQQPPEAEPARDPLRERIITLSDGVFAIALTLLAFEIRLPQGSDGSLVSLLARLADPLQMYFWCFLSLSFFWFTHHQSFATFRRADGPIATLNLIVLGLVTLVPALTRIFHDTGFRPATIAIYLGLFEAIAIVNAASWFYACAAGIVPDTIGPARRIYIGLTKLIMPGATTSLGVLSTQPGLRWLPLLFLPLFAGVGLAHRAVMRLDAVPRSHRPAGAFAGPDAAPAPETP